MNLMFDEGANDPKIVEALNKLRSFNAACCLDCGFDRGEDDGVLVRQTKFNRIFVSKNATEINERNYPPGTHRGIITFTDNEFRLPYVVARFKALLALNWEHQAKQNVVIIQDEDITLHTSTGSTTEVFRLPQDGLMKEYAILKP